MGGVVGCEGDPEAALGVGQHRDSRHSVTSATRQVPFSTNPGSAQSSGTLWGPGAQAPEASRPAHCSSTSGKAVDHSGLAFFNL